MEVIINYLYPIVTVIGLVILYFTIKNLLPSYFNEKGKNLATQQDIEKITLLVEQVKLSFTKETEHLKANLNFLTNIQSSLFSEERSAIIEYNEKYFKWLNLLVDSSMNDVNKFNVEELEAYSKTLSNAYRDFLSAQTKFNLFVENKDLIEFANQLKIDTLKLLDEHPYECITSLQNAIREWERIKKFEAPETHTQKHKEYLEKFSAATEKFRKSILENYKIIFPQSYTFQKMCREHLYQLVKKESK